MRKEITKLVEIRTNRPKGSLYKPFEGTIRITMWDLLDKETIGVLTSKGWSVFPGYILESVPHPLQDSDDSWFRVYKTGG